MSLSPYLGRKRPRSRARTFYRSPPVEPAPAPEPPPAPEPVIDPARYVVFADLVILPTPFPIPKPRGT